MKNINKIISGILFSLVILGTSQVDASLKKKLGKRFNSTVQKNRQPISLDRFISGKRNRILQGEIAKEVADFVIKIEKINPLTVENIYSDNSLIIKTFDINTLPGKTNAKKIDNTIVKVYLGKIEIDKKIYTITMPDGSDTETTEVLIPNKITNDFISRENNIYAITKIEVLSENKTLLQKISYLGKNRIFNILELNKNGKYTMNNTLWGGNKQALTSFGIGAMMILAAGANTYVGKNNLKSLVTTDNDSNLQVALYQDPNDFKDGFIKNETCSIEDMPKVCTDKFSRQEVLAIEAPVQPEQKPKCSQVALKAFSCWTTGNCAEKTLEAFSCPFRK